MPICSTWADGPQGLRLDRIDQRAHPGVDRTAARATLSAALPPRSAICSTARSSVTLIFLPAKILAPCGEAHRPASAVKPAMTAVSRCVLENRTGAALVDGEAGQAVGLGREQIDDQPRRQVRDAVPDAVHARFAPVSRMPSAPT